MGVLLPSLHKNQPNHKKKEQKKKQVESYRAGEELSVSAIRDWVKHVQISFIHSSPPTPRRRHSFA